MKYHINIAKNGKHFCDIIIPDFIDIKDDVKEILSLFPTPKYETSIWLRSKSSRSVDIKDLP